jgi:hypothetical protein
LNPPHDHRTLIHHRAALGDTVLLWPLLRALAFRAGPPAPKEVPRVAFASDAAKARLASRFLGIEPVDAEHPVFGGLWRGEAPASGMRFDRVLWFGPPADAQGADRFERSLRAAFGASDVRLIQHRPDRGTAARIIRELGLTPAPVATRRNPDGPVVLHIGAGSETKRWPMPRWVQVHEAIRRTGRAVVVIAGEVELERLPPADRERLAAIGGRFLATLDELADDLADASLVITCDTGPGHLAAQLGVPTLALFGPTDPERWAPVGPAAWILAPDAPTDMAWLAPEVVLRHMLERDL